MKDALKEKLKDCLGIDKLNEHDVVYILIEIGKLIEITNTQEQYKVLSFYRNWIAHSQIDKQTAYVNSLKNSFQIFDKNPNIILTDILNFLSFEGLKNEIRKFYDQQIEKGLIPNNNFLGLFEGSLKEIIADIPVRLKIDQEISLTFDHHGKLHIQGSNIDLFISLEKS
jgi:hypothetical protein